MKIALIALLVTLSAQARQYMQCAPFNSTSTNRMVINLDGADSTLFMTSGLLTDWDMEPEIRVLKDLNFDSSDESFHTYSTEGEVVESVKIPSEVIGEYSNFFLVEVTHTSETQSRSVEMSCFSSLYND